MNFTSVLDFSLSFTMFNVSPDVNININICSIELNEMGKN